jgi:hypothetical protein
MTEQTPAQDYAAFLRAVAEHLDAHPHLTEPWIRPGPIPMLHIPTTEVPVARSFVAWCRSLGVRDLHVGLFPQAAHVHAVDVPIGDVVVAELWAGVDGLQRHLVQGGGYTKLPLTLAELEYFAEHGSLPEAGAR